LQLEIVCIEAESLNSNWYSIVNKLRAASKIIIFTFSPFLSNSIAFAFRRIVFPVPKDDVNASLLLCAVVLIKLS